jgi:hypothetical protein
MWGFLTLNRGGSEFDNELTTATVYGFGHISNLQAIPNMTWHTRLICLYIIATCIYNTLFPNPIMRVLSDQWYILIRVTQCCLNLLFNFNCLSLIWIWTCTFLFSIDFIIATRYVASLHYAMKCMKWFIYIWQYCFKFTICLLQYLGKLYVYNSHGPWL